MKLPHLTRARRPALLAAATLVAALLALAGADAGAAERPLATAIQDFDYTATHFDRVRAAGARTVKLVFPWRRIAPDVRPADFDPANPDDPRYDWEPVRRSGARGGRTRPGAADHDRAGAAVGRARHGRAPCRPGIPTRPSSAPSARRSRAATAAPCAGLPRVRLFEAWNEPNASFFLSPRVS